MSLRGLPAAPQCYGIRGCTAARASRGTDRLGRSLFWKILAANLISAAIAGSIVAAAAGSEVPPGIPGQMLLVWVAALVLVATAVSFVAARSVTAPLTRLGRQLEAPAEEDRPIQLDVAGPSAQKSLARAVNRMAADLAARLEELRSESHLREQILASMSVGVVLQDRSGAVIYSNPVAANMLGASLSFPSEALGVGQSEFTVHYPSRRELRTLSVTLEDGRRLIMLDDVTEAKRVEAMRRDFVADASHELKTPVGGILATAETLEVAAREDPQKVPNFVSSLLHEARRLSRLVQELLDLARLEQPAGEVRPVHLSGLVRREIANAAFLAKSKGLDLTADIAGGLVVPGDVEDFALAIRNVLDNALRYTSDGEVAVRLHRADGRALLEVADTGIGIAGRDLERIFERFYRVDPARSRQTGGTGLGLSIARHALERHGGEITARSRLGKGSVFVISLPVEPEEGGYSPPSSTSR